MKKLVLAVGFLVAVGCVHSNNETPAPEIPTPVLSRQPQSSQDFIDGASGIFADVQNPAVFNADTCAPYINKLTQQIYSLPSKYFVPSGSSEIAQMKAQGSNVLQNLFQTRLKIREHLTAFEKAGTAKPECVKAVREGFRYLRFAEEMLIEWMQKEGVYDQEKPDIFGGKFPHTLTNPKFAGQIDIRPGDLMLVRGKSYVSAMIARIGDEEGQFSHLVLVGQDSAGKLYALEALIQYGVIVTPLEKWRKEQDARVVLYRNPDAALAKRAARLMYDKAAPRFYAKDNIKYDFAMDDDNSDRIFCAELISHAYKLASNNQFKMPLHRTTITKFKGTGYLEGMGISKPSFFAPADMEVDTRFEEVAEFRHWPLLRQVRMQDSVLASVYSWMSDGGYRYHWSMFHGGKGVLAKMLRQFGLFTDQLPTYMPMNTLQMTLQFESVANALQDNIYEKEAQYYKANGHSMSFAEMLVINEQFRREDCRKHMDALNGDPMAPGDLSKFHWFFYPERGCAK